jgi:fructose-1,6-bisphosphatase II
MEKLVVRAAAARAVSLEQSIEENLAEVAAALDKPVSSLVVGVQDRPRHAALIADIRQAGAAVALFGDGDVMASLRVLLPAGDLDVLAGVGGAPEGVITACAARLLGGTMQGRLAPQSAAERARLSEVSVALGPGGVGAVLTLDDLVATDECVFAATAVTGGALLARPEPAGAGYRTSSFVATPDHPAMFVESVR